MDNNKPEGKQYENPPQDTQAKFVIGCSDEDFEEAVEEAEVYCSSPRWRLGLGGCCRVFHVQCRRGWYYFYLGDALPFIEEVFGASNSEVAWISSLLGGFYLRPFVAALANAFGFRLVCILGAVIVACSCTLSYFATSIYFLYGSFGILGGMGFGLIYVPAVIATGFYFEKRRALATGIAVCGSGIGTFVLSPINTYVLTNYEDKWEIIFLIYAGISLSCVFFGLAFRPLTAATGKRRKMVDDDLEVHGTPLLMRIKRARDHELAQCPSALSMSSSYSASPSKMNLEEHQFIMNGDVKVSVAKTLLERHGGGMMSKRSSFPGVAIPGAHEPILEEAETALGEDENGTERKNSSSTEEHTQLQEADAGVTQSLLPPSPHQQLKPLLENGTLKDKPHLDKNKNETSINLSPNMAKETSMSFAKSSNSRNMSAPSLTLQANIGNNDIRRRPSRGALRTEVSRPFYRNDIFYSGSLARLPQYQSSDTVNQYHASVTNIPPMDVLADNEKSAGCCSCALSIKHVLLKIFDFSLMTSPTFIVLSVSGFLALMSLFVPFNFLPSFCTDNGIAPADTSFLMSLIGICNTVGRIIAGWISDHPKVDALVVNNLALIIGGVATVLLPLMTDLSLMYFYAVVFGFSLAAFASLRSILLVELLGLEKLTNAFGLLLLFQGFAATFGSPIAGAFVDLTQEYKISFYVFGSLFALAGILCVPLRWLKKWEDNRIDDRLRKEKYGIE
ncbi:Monocarboxylate transporter 5 [Armadillidium vulgare]|nr:Monocarboxylate transporter 5 [Armadillidium vulgare]